MTAYVEVKLQGVSDVPANRFDLNFVSRLYLMRTVEHSLVGNICTFPRLGKGLANDPIHRLFQNLLFCPGSLV